MAQKKHHSPCFRGPWDERETRLMNPWPRREWGQKCRDFLYPLEQYFLQLLHREKTGQPKAREIQTSVAALELPKDESVYHIVLRLLVKFRPLTNFQRTSLHFPSFDNTKHVAKCTGT